MPIRSAVPRCSPSSAWRRLSWRRPWRNASPDCGRFSDQELAGRNFPTSSRKQIERLHRATQETLTGWIELLRAEAGDSFPGKVTAFRPEMTVHGKFGQPCPVCGAKVQRIRYADNETNYCPACQTGGRLLADRSLSRLVKRDWPKTPEDLEELRGRSATP